MMQANEAIVTEPQLVEFGPYRVIGTRCVGGSDSSQFSAMWEQEFLPRVSEIVTAEGAEFTVGLCRCLPGVTDGSFEYLAAMPASAEAPVPAGMVEAHLAAATYVVFPVAGLAEIMAAWGKLGPWQEAHPEWEGYCTPSGCDCATHPSFELYPPTFAADGTLYLYLPVRKRAG